MTYLKDTGYWTKVTRTIKDEKKRFKIHKLADFMYAGASLKTARIKFKSMYW